MFTENLSEFFDPTEMADNATIGSTTVAGVFDNQFVEVLGIESLRAVFTCAQASVPSIAHGDALSIKSTSYKVVGVQSDGTGLTQLILEKQ